MLKTITKSLKRMLPEGAVNALRGFNNKFFDGYSTKSYSQEGEDMILKYIFRFQSSGFYVDIGAHHPKRFSNTYHFYNEGWKGINIDAMPGSMNKFNRVRPRDINLEIPISNQNSTSSYFIFAEPAYNTFDRDLASERERRGLKLLEEKKVQTQTLKGVLEKHLPNGTTIDLLSVDVEGLDLQVLQSNDWEKYRPKVIVCESVNLDIDDETRDEMSRFLQDNGYVAYAKTVHSLIYKESNASLGEGSSK